MSPTPTQGELCLAVTVVASAATPTASGPGGPDPFVPDPTSPVPLTRLRPGDREPITPETCRVTDCPVCAWRRAGLLPPLASGSL